MFLNWVTLAWAVCLAMNLWRRSPRYVCMCMYMYVCMYERCMYVLWRRSPRYVVMYIHTYMCICIHMFSWRSPKYVVIYIHTYMCICIHMFSYRLTVAWAMRLAMGLWRPEALHNQSNDYMHACMHTYIHEHLSVLRMKSCTIRAMTTCMHACIHT